MRPRAERRHPGVRQPAADADADQRRELHGHHGVDPGIPLAEAELLLEDVRHPVLHDPAGQRGQREIEDQEEIAPVGDQFPQTRSSRRVRPPAVRSVAADRAAARERQGVEHADDPAGLEREPPAEVRLIGHVTRETAEDDPGVDPHLVDPDGPRPRRTRRCPPCIVHLHSATAFIRHYNGAVGATRGEQLMERMEDFCIRSADALLCPSRYYARQCVNHFALPEDSVEVIPLPVGITPAIERDPSVWRTGRSASSAGSSLGKGSSNG